MTTATDTGKNLLRLAEELSAMASASDCASVEDRAGMLVALSEIAAQAKYAGLTPVLEAARALTAMVDQDSVGAAVTVAEGIARLQVAIQGVLERRSPA
jgi:hypothetical protein